LEQERKDILAKAKKVLQSSGPNERGSARARRQFFETALEHQDDYSNHDRDEGELDP
jgi:hypothetical protein